MTLHLSINVRSCTLMDMTKVTASQFKAKLGKYMQTVRAGGAVLVTDRGVPVARFAPVDGRETKASGQAESEHFGMPDPAAPPLGDIVIKGISFRGTNSLKLLRADRQR